MNNIKNQNKYQEYILSFEKLRITDFRLVGGKNASIGEMINQLSKFNISVPNGFAITTTAFKDFLCQKNLNKNILKHLKNFKNNNMELLSYIGKDIRQLIIETPFQLKLEDEIYKNFINLKNKYPGKSFAIRSSAILEDLPNASFAGQQETYLNVIDIEDVLICIKNVFASLYNDRAISYRSHHGFKENEDTLLSVGVQEMVRSDIGSSGVMFTLDTESGFQDVVFITSSYGLGEAIVQGSVNPDEFYVFKKSLYNGNESIIRRSIGSKLIKMEFSNNKYDNNRVKIVNVTEKNRNQFSINDDDIILLAKYAVIIEKHYNTHMDIEWGKDGENGKIYILQARPETVNNKSFNQIESKIKLKKKSNILIKGRAIGQKIGSGRVRIINSPADMFKFKKKEVLVADMTDPNWEPAMKIASAIVTNRGGRTCHAAIIARELGVPAVVGCSNATEILKEGEFITVCCSEGDEGIIYDGILETEVINFPINKNYNKLPIKIMLNIGNPQLAFSSSNLPNDGVGLARLEFIINTIGIHPKAILEYNSLNQELQNKINSITSSYNSPRLFYINKLIEGISTIGAAFYPKQVIVRFSDFKSNEYKKLIGGSLYELNEENPMLGFRGAARYLSMDFMCSFEMECIALKFVREKMGLDNIDIMIPFVRTVKQASDVIELLSKFGLRRSKSGLKIFMMCEIPSNIILAEEFLKYFDGFSIGSNDLTQLILGIDRDSGEKSLTNDFDERNIAVKFMLKYVINICKKLNKYIGICGQGPSDHPDFAKWLVSKGVTSISLNPDSVINITKNLLN